VALGDTVLVDVPKPPIIDATKVSVQSTTSLSFSLESDIVIKSFIAEYLTGRYIVRGQYFSLSIYGTQRKFQIVDIEPTWSSSLMTSKTNSPFASPTKFVTSDESLLTVSPIHHDHNSATGKISAECVTHSLSHSLLSPENSSPKCGPTETSGEDPAEKNVENESIRSPQVYKVTSATIFFYNENSTQKNTSLQTLHDNDLSWSSIGGLRKELELIRETVEIPLKKPEIFARLGLPPQRGLLLYGPSGSGKTLIVKVLAKECNARLFIVNGPEVMSKYYGESEAKLREIFKEATLNAPSLIFFDEIDALAPAREQSNSEVERRIVGTLLSLMDGIDSKESTSSRVVVIAATNRPNAIDPALRRPGRFDKEIEIGIPNEAGRREILEIYMKKLPHALKSQDIDYLASVTHGYSGADLYSLCKEAALKTLKRKYHTKPIDSLSDDEIKELTVTAEDFNAALTEIRPSAMREVMVEIPRVRWEDIGGYEDIKQQLQQLVEWPIKYADRFSRLGIKPPQGILLYGPPGCSKTLLAKAVASESKLNFIPIKGPELLNKYVGESERGIREVFRKARNAAPSVIFFDELDALAVERGRDEETSGVHDRVLSQMLNELDGISPLKNVVFLAATNRPDIIVMNRLRFNFVIAILRFQVRSFAFVVSPPAG